MQMCILHSVKIQYSLPLYVFKYYVILSLFFSAEKYNLLHVL